jgi:hypothetical protein
VVYGRGGGYRQPLPEARLEQIGKQVMVTKPLALVIQSNDEKVRTGKIFQNLWEVRRI